MSMIFIISLYIIIMSFPDNFWDCKFCIASGNNFIWNAKRNGGNFYADEKQLTRSWLTHQGICQKRKKAFQNWMSSTSSSSSSSSSIGLGQKRAFEFMDTCLDDTGFFYTERAKEYLTNKQQEEPSSTEELQQYDEYNADDGADFSSSSTSSSSFERREQQQEQEQEQEPDQDDNSDVPFCLRTSKKV